MKSLLLAAGISAVAFVSAAQASDLIIDDARVMPGVVQGNFDGAFVGVFGGGALTDLEFPVFGDELSLIAGGIAPDGWLLGVDAGFNFAVGNGLVLGVVGDIAWANVTDGVGFPGEFGFDSTIDWLGSLRARAGYDAGNFMPYLTAGLAFAHNTVEAPGEDVGESFSDDQTHLGWTIGAGVEFAVADNLSIDANYRYSDYGDASYALPGDGGSADLGLTSHQLTVGLHYGF